MQPFIKRRVEEIEAEVARKPHIDKTIWSQKPNASNDLWTF
jgi:hypothetical protein